jgi:hypothetical protein
VDSLLHAYRTRPSNPRLLGIGVSRPDVPPDLQCRRTDWHLRSTPCGDGKWLFRAVQSRMSYVGAISGTLDVNIGRAKSKIAPIGKSPNEGDENIKRSVQIYKINLTFP